MTRSPAFERLGVLEQRLTDHEARCEERLGEIKSAAASTLSAVEGLKTRSWGVVAALLTWALAQVWSGAGTRLERLEAERPTLAQTVVAARSQGDTAAGPAHQQGDAR